MKNNKPSTPTQRDYALRRILYDMLIAAKAVELMATSGKDYSAKETAKMAGLIVARNLDDFFCSTNHQHDDDIFVVDFGTGWTPPQKARLSEKQRKRINKLMAHVVAQSEPVFRDGETTEIIKALIRVGVKFIEWCLKNGHAKYTGKARPYAQRLNGILPRLAIPKVPA